MPKVKVKENTEENDVKQIAQAIERGVLGPHYKVSVERGENEYKDRYVLSLKDPADNQKEYHLAHLFPKKNETTGESYYVAHVFPNVIIAAYAFGGTHPISEHPPVTDVSLLYDLTYDIVKGIKLFLHNFEIAYLEIGNPEKPFRLLLYKGDFPEGAENL